jgi:diaminopimelate decarboxylase
VGLPVDDGAVVVRPEGRVDVAPRSGDDRCRHSGIRAGRCGISRSQDMTLPGSPQVAYRGDSLFLEDVSIADLAREHGTPLYAYSQGSMLEALRGYQSALDGREHLICYAVKANPTLAVLQTFVRAGCGFDIVSGGELLRALAAGADAQKIVFSGVGKRREEMRLALDAGVLCFNVESEEELRVLSTVAQDARRIAKVSLRVNPDVDAGTHPYISTGLKKNKFGIAHEDAVAAYRLAVALPNLEIVGIDCHIGSQITDPAPYLDAVDRLIDLIESIESHGIPVPHIDLGGGLGIAYSTEAPPAAKDLIDALLARIDARGHGHRKILVEPGRSIVGNAGVLISEVLYLKHNADKSFCIVDAAMNDLVRPALYDAWMDIVPCRQRTDIDPVRYDVVGPICESGDWLGHDRSLRVAPGDLVAVLSAGAYCMSMASNYNSRGRAAEVLVAGRDAWLFREREAGIELFKNEPLLSIS